MLKTIEIDGDDVSADLISFEKERTYGDTISEVTLKFVRRVTSTTLLTPGMTVEIWRGFVTALDEKVFSGYIEKVEPEGGVIIVTALDKLWDLVRKEVTHVYDSTIDASAGVISEIFEDLVTTYGSLTADATTIQDSGTVILLQKFVCNHTDIFERCKALAEVLDWQFYYRADTDNVYFEPKGFSTNATTLTVGSNVIKVPKWNYDNTEMVNSLTVVGAYQEVETTESGRIGTTSGYTTASIAIAYEPISVKVYGDASNPPTTLKTGGLPDSTVTFDYYVDKPQKKIYPKAGTTFTTNDYYEIRYSAAVPIPVHMYDQLSIDTYGEFRKTVTYNDIRSVVDAENRGTNHLAKYSVPFVYTTLQTKNISSTGLTVGQKVRVVDTINSPNVDQYLLINRYRMRWPADYDEIEVGDKIWRLAEFQADVLEKIKRLEEDEFANTNIVNELVNVDTRVSYPIEVEPRYQWVLRQNVTGMNIFILGHSTYGLLGTGKLGATDLSAEIDHCIIQYQNTYTETFYDTDFKSGSTTADWDTTNKWLDFGAGEIGQSLSIDYANGTITTATMTVTISSGTFTLALSANGGSNWETVTSGTAHAFSNTSTDLRWKITESGASTGKITQIVISSYH